MQYPGTWEATGARLRNALVAATALHAAIVLSVGFDISESAYQAPQIEVTLASRHAERAPDDARLIAANNQVGSGDPDELNRMTSPQSLPAASPAEQRLPRQRREPHEMHFQDAVTTRALNRRAVNAERAERRQQNPDLAGISPELDRLDRELTGLQAELAEQLHNNSPRVRRLSAASARQSADAAYLLDWRRRLEAVGNQFYPRASVRYGIYGDLRLLVVIRADGSLEDIRVLSSSGYAVLDEAAIKIVRMAAPYAPFPPELRATTDKLEIVRTWQFRQNQLSSNQGPGAMQGAL